MAKARMNIQIREALMGTKSVRKRSPDIEELKERFQILRVKIKQLIEALKAQHASMVQLQKVSMTVAKRMADIAVGSPIASCAGEFPLDDEETTNADLNSYLSVHLSMTSREEVYADRFSKSVVDYAVDWERVLVARISTSLKKSEELRRELEHYNSKVESIRIEIKKVISKGKIVDPKQADKLKRNEIKLAKAQDEYKNFSSDLRILMEEMIDRSWKDLHPILLKMVQFDVQVASDEYMLFSNLKGVADILKKLAHRHNLKPETRLQDLESMSAKEISTKDHEDALEGIPTKPAIMGPGAFNPIPQADKSAQQHDHAIRGRSDSNGESTASSDVEIATTTSAMLEVASKSAPPPTLAMVNEALSSEGTDLVTKKDNAQSTYNLKHGQSARGGSGYNPFDSFSSDTGNHSRRDEVSRGRTDANTNPFDD